VLASCTGCGKELPRWFFLNKGSARGPYSLYKYPIASQCRICRHEKGLAPIAWNPGETEAEYNERAEKAAAELVARRMR
jgi:hypothetical protein